MTPTPTLTQTPTITQTPTESMTPTPTESMTPTPSVTQTMTQTPTLTSTPTPTNVPYVAYLFPEPSDATSINNLGQYMFDNGASWYGYWNDGGPPAGASYSSNLDIYAHYSGWSQTVDSFFTPVTNMTGAIRQTAGVGTDSFGCTQSQYTFGTIAVTTAMVDPDIQYYYSIWIPLAGVGGSMTNMTVDIGSGAVCSTNIVNDGLPDSLAATNVTITSDAAIPAGTYRVLWVGTFAAQPTAPPLSVTLYFKGDTKT